MHHLTEPFFLMQIDQAIGMKAETEHYRRWQNKLDSSGRGLTMGAMYWMLNDIWQAPTWSSLGITCASLNDICYFYYVTFLLLSIFKFSFFLCSVLKFSNGHCF